MGVQTAGRWRLRRDSAVRSKNATLGCWWALGWQTDWCRSRSSMRISLERLVRLPVGWWRKTLASCG